MNEIREGSLCEGGHERKRVCHISMNCGNGYI
jgi:hypothetical protein